VTEEITGIDLVQVILVGCCLLVVNFEVCTALIIGIDLVQVSSGCVCLRPGIP